MTALTTGLALVPLLLAGNIAGQEIEYPMAIVIIGGLICSTLLNLFVVPSLYLLPREEQEGEAGARDGNGMRRALPAAALALAVALVAGCGGGSGSGTAGGATAPRPDRELLHLQRHACRSSRPPRSRSTRRRFSDPLRIDNAWFPMAPGTQLVLRARPTGGGASWPTAS